MVSKFLLLAASFSFSLSIWAYDLTSLEIDPAVCGILSRPSLKDRAAQIGELKSTMISGLTRLTPHAVTGDPASIFAGNYDWHSSVHGHWALLSLARLTQDAELESQLANRITVKALTRIRKNLNQNIPYDEMPYGQAWLVLMLHELQNASHKHSLLNAEAHDLQSETTERLIQYLSTSPFPEMGNRFSGMHGSWAFAYMLLKFSQPPEKFSIKMAQLEVKFQTQIHGLENQNTPTPTDFMFLPGISALIRSDLSYHDGPMALPVSTPTDPYRAHSSGAFLTSIWPYAVQSYEHNAGSCRIFNENLNEFFNRPDLWQTDFANVGHWVPQFTWFGIALEQGGL